MSCKTNICNCGSFSGPLWGHDNCVTKAGYTARLAFMPITDSSGKRNYIDFGIEDPLTPGLRILNPDIDETFFDNIMRVVSNDKKFYLSPRVENVAFEPQDPLTETLDSGREIDIKDIGTNVTAFLVDDEATFEAFKESLNLKCGNWGFFEIDSNGNLIGDVSDSDDFKLYPIPINRLRPQFFRKTPTTSQKIQVSFKFDDMYNEGNNGIFPCSLMDVNLITLPEIKRVTMEVDEDTIALGTFEVKLTSNLPDNFSNNKITGLDVSDFELIGNTGMPVSIISVDETSDGIYKIDYDTSDSSLEIIKLELDYDGHVAAPVFIVNP